jgi:hypothetical protein
MTFPLIVTVATSALGAVIVALVAPWMSVSGRSSRLWRPGCWYRSVSSADPCLCDSCVRCKTLSALKVAAASLAVWRQQLHPTTTGAPNCNLTAAHHSALSHPHTVSTPKPSNSIARDAHHGQHQLADHQHRRLGPRQPRQLRPELSHSRGPTCGDRRCPEQCTANTAAIKRR